MLKYASFAVLCFIGVNRHRWSATAPERSCHTATPMRRDEVKRDHTAGGQWMHSSNTTQTSSVIKKKTNPSHL